ncbi:PAS domain S-box protein [Priestia megaterium]|nr:PAS domain S-box protein [Priestia megaterium]
MIIKEFFIGLSIFTFLLSLGIFIRVFFMHNPSRSYYWFAGIYAGGIAVVLMYFNIPYTGVRYDIWIIPLILSFIYFGRIAGWITLAFIVMMRIFYIGGYWEPPVVNLVGVSILFTICKTYFKNLSAFKSISIYLIIHVMMTRFIVNFFSLLTLPILSQIQSEVFSFLGLLIGLFLIEAYHKLYRLIQELDRMKQVQTTWREELKETVHELQGGIFKFKKVNDDFIHTLCDGQFYYKNGLNPEEVIVGKKLRNLDSFILPPYLVTEITNYYEQAWEGREVTFELPWLNDKTFVFVSLRPIIREGKVIEVVGSTADITERKKMEEELRATKDRLESFVRHNVDAIVLYDVEGHVLQVNEAYENIFGWSAKEIIGKKVPSVPDYLLKQVSEDVQKIISGRFLTSRFETVSYRKDGRLIDVCVTLSPILGSNGEVTALSAIIRDISERKQAQEKLHQLNRQLQESEMKYRALFENATDAIYLYELNEEQIPVKCLDVNPVACKKLKYSKEEITSRSPDSLHPQFTQVAERIGKEIRKGRRFFIFQNEYTTQKKVKKHSEVSSRIFTLDGKEVLLCISRDITERIKTEELLRKSEKLAVVGQLATAIAHEIRNPLTTMKGFMQLLKSTENKSSQRYIDLMLSESNQIERITNEFMMVAKPQAVKVQPNDIHMIVEQVVILLQPQATMHNVQIRTELEADIPVIVCEKNQLKQVFINILKNAIEAMSEGGEVWIQIAKLDNHQVNIRFIDQGRGIPKERIPYLGEPFYSIKEEGIGLGLTICYKIVETHQGKITIESEVDKGTTVDVTLPIGSLSQQRILEGEGRC